MTIKHLQSYEPLYKVRLFRNGKFRGNLTPDWGITYSWLHTALAPKAEADRAAALINAGGDDILIDGLTEKVVEQS